MLRNLRKHLKTQQRILITILRMWQYHPKIVKMCNLSTFRVPLTFKLYFRKSNGKNICYVFRTPWQKRSTWPLILTSTISDTSASRQLQGTSKVLSATPQLYASYKVQAKYTDKIFLIYKEIQSGAVAKSYMRKGFLIYEEMRKYISLYIRTPLVILYIVCNCSTLNFLIYEEHFIFFFISILSEVKSS